MTDPIKVWEFYSAPKEYQALSGHGGDEDWLALIPKELYSQQHGIPLWMEGGVGSFGVCDTSIHFLDNGDVVAIGAHA